MTLPEYSSETAHLTCHTAMPCAAVDGIEVRISWLDGGFLRLAYRLEGRLTDILVPGEAPAGPADGLWRHTCFEAFIAVEGEPAYREFNFSPSGQWALYGFSAYRQRDAWTGTAPEISGRHLPGHLELDAIIPPALLPASAGARWELALSAVVETVNGSLSYWALSHPAAQPDFHHRDGFALKLAEASLA